MTIGQWRTQASSALQTAARTMTGRATDVTDAYAVIDARTQVYRHLGRMVELLAGRRPAVQLPSWEAASAILDRSGQSTKRLYVGLQWAVTRGEYPPAPQRQPSAMALRRAADAVGAAGDILASHVRPPRGGRPSPEGLAILAQGGVPAAMGDVAHLTLQMLAVDARMLEWLDDRHVASAQALRPVFEAAWWTTRSRLADAADELMTAAAGQPRLVDDLEVSRQPLDPVPAVSTAENALSALAAARGWLWQHRDEAAVGHLRIGTQVGLAVHTALAVTAPDPDQVAAAAADRRRARWRSAAAAAAELRGTPATGEARGAGLELAEVLRWARSQTVAPGHGQNPDPELTEGLTRIAAQLPGLAHTLQVGLQDAIRRHDVFVAGPTLLRAPGQMIYQVNNRWQQAAVLDDQVMQLSQALTRIARQSPASTAAAAATLAFTPPVLRHTQQPIRTSTQTPTRRTTAANHEPIRSKGR
ncbi:hypothetical protein [Actinoplanes regularis]|uniref:hypothetical protein n=1 Tax=Actinoplanes regularis TaxID=52697 RepID=UPI0024A48D58|nr:hypothetical protein [Actinoplanes regularis]GLW35224.1 hypothetical protein Areg01_81600 [Actinoplanes regularis]